MKRTLLILTFVLSLIFALSVVSLAAEDEYTYYVVQSEESDLASTLKDEGKSVVGIEKLYSSYSDSTAADSTYFVNQFDGKTLNLILAENVSYSMEPNPSNPTGSGIRLDKAINMNVYFNGHYWWIPDDNRYAGFFINNQGACLTLIGNRTIEEVQEGFDVTKVNAKAMSNGVDYYGGYIGFYIVKGDLTIKNAIVISEDELIYQKDGYASGTTNLKFDTCFFNNKDRTCRTIHFKSSGKSDISFQMDHTYADRIAINNILADSYINNSRIASLYIDSWHADSLIGKEYIYINNTVIGDYYSDGDTNHIIATNSSFNDINLNGDSSGGGFATLINSTYKSVVLKRQSATRNGVLNIVTPADCDSPAIQVVYTYDDETQTNISYIDEEYSKVNPALGHNTDGGMLSMSYTSYLERGNGNFLCSICGEEYEAKGVFEPLFTFVGYSVFEGASGSFAIGYSVNKEALAKYEEISDKTINYGIFVVLKDVIGKEDIFGADGKPATGVLSADITKYSTNLFELKVIGITEKREYTGLVMGAYAATKFNGVTEYEYLQGDKPSEGEIYSSTSYGDTLDEISSKEVVALDDITVEIGQSIELPKTVTVRGHERELTYSFDSSVVSVDNYILTGVTRNKGIEVAATAKGFTGKFTITVIASPSDAYQHVVIIGVDGAGTFFQNAQTPNIDSIFANGATTYNCLTSNPTISAQCWGSLLHGVTPQVHGLTNDNISSAYPSNSEYPSFFRVIRENNPDAVLASFCNWNPINVGIIEDDIGVHKATQSSDSALTEEILAYLESNTPTAMFVQFDEADGAGHSSGYGSDTQLSKIAEIDSYIGRIYEAYEANGTIDDTLFIVTADHGGSGTSHGGLTDAEKYVMFAATGKNVQNATIEDMEIRDTASIVLHALGYFEQPSKWTSRVPSGLFEGIIAEERPNVPGRHHTSEPTPEKDSDGYVDKFITDHTLSTYLTFDGSVKDSCGGSTNVGKTVGYEDGYFGQGIVLDKGYASINNFAKGTDSFTIAFWLNTDGVTSNNADPCIFSNKNWDSGKYKGIAFSLTQTNVKFNFGDGSNRVDREVSLPADYQDGWVHFIVFVDRTNHKIGVCIDFETIFTIDIPASLQEDSVDTEYSLNIGQDGRGTYSWSLPGTMDEFMIFDGAFDKDDVDKLAQYYGIR